MSGGNRIASVGALLVAVACVSSGLGQEAEPAPPPEPPPLPANANPLSALDLDSLTATRELPLFTPSRTPPAVVEAEPESEPEPVEAEIVEETDPEPPPLELIGIVVTDAEQVVLLLDQSTGEVQRIRPGDDFQGWTVSIIDSRTVELVSEGSSQTLTMFTGMGEEAAPPDAFEDEDEDEGEDFDTGVEPDGSGTDQADVDEHDFEDESFEDEVFPDGTSEDAELEEFDGGDEAEERDPTVE